MKAEFAIDYIPRRMRELGFSDYLTRWRNIQVDANTTLKIDAANEFYMLIEPSTNISVQSKFGMYNAIDTTINEMQYEHRGKIFITNATGSTQMVLFIQVIPTHKK